MGDGSMIRDYGAYLQQRWDELGMPAKVAALPDDPEQQKPLQSGWLIGIASELRYTTMCEGRLHPDVGLLFKNFGNFYHDAASGLDIATDILNVKDTDGAGNVIGGYAIVDVLVSSGGRAARTAWQPEGIAADQSRWRDAPQPTVVQPPAPPVDPPIPPTPPADDQVLVLLQLMIDRHELIGAKQIELLDRIAAGVEGLRRDTASAAKLLAQLIAGGGIGDLFKTKAMRGAQRPILELSSVLAIEAKSLPMLPKDFDKHDDWRARLARAVKGRADGEAQNRRTNNRKR
jgi:hypothetical protein